MAGKSLSRALQRMERFRLTPNRHDAGSAGFDLTEEDLIGALVEKKPPPLLFERFNEPRIRHDLEVNGILQKILARGYHDVRVVFDSESFYDSRFRLIARHPLVDGDCTLIDCLTHRGEVAGESPFTGEAYRLKVLLLEWINFQDPARPLRHGTLALPGQTHPGLGVFREALQVTISYMREVDMDAVFNVPEYFHNALLYSSYFRFFSPQREGRFQAMKRDLLSLGLAESSIFLDEGKVLLDGDPPRPIRWVPAEQVYPINPRLEAYFRSDDYLKAVREEMEVTRYRYDPQALAHQEQGQ